MTDLDERLGSALERLAAERAPGPATDVLAPVHARVRRRHRARLGATFALPLLFIGLMAWAAWPTERDETPVVTDPDPTTTTTLPAAVDEAASDAVPGVVELDPGPLSPRRWPAVVDLGDGRLFVWGGESADDYLEGLVDGAVYDTADGAWSLIDPAPVPPDASRGSTAVLAGRYVVVFSDTSAAAWDVDTGEWRTIDGELPGPVHDAVWTGDEVLAFSPRATVEAVTDKWTAIDPATAEMRSLPDTMHVVQHIEWMNDQVITVGRTDCCGDYEASAFDPSSSTWRELPGGSISPGWFTGARSGDSIVLVDDSGWAAAFDGRTEEWQELPVVPIASTREAVEVVETGAGPAALLGSSISLLDDDGVWHPMPLEPGVDGLLARPVGFGGGRIVRYGARNDSSGPPVNRFQVIDVEELRDSGTVYFGVRFDLPDEAELGSIATTDPNRPTRTASATVDLGGRECTVAARLGTHLVGTTAGTMAIEPTDGSDRWDAHRVGGSTGSALGRGSLTIDCGSLDRTVELASYIRPPDHWYDE